MATHRPKKIRILLVDDHPIVREGLKSSLNSRKTMEVVGEASNGAEAIRLAKDLKPDIILLDINMPLMNGLDASKRLRRETPHSKIIVLTMHDNKEYILRISQLGARGYVLKDSSPAELFRAIEIVLNGELFFTPKASQLILSAFVKRKRKKSMSSELTYRQEEILKLIAEGLTTSDIAEKLGLSSRTVQTHRERIISKLGIDNIAGLIRFALRKGIIDLE
ncbi:MAG: response regulator transcription factor [Ignavibacteriales bacterium]|nr:response regulator transcription factor [Ignavibacteriales bacterium]